MNHSSQKISFKCDYAEGACPEILEALVRTNLEQTDGFDVWQPFDDTHTVVRFATSWTTTPESPEKLRTCFEKVR